MSTDEDTQQQGGSSMDEVADEEEKKGEGAPGNEPDPVESLRKELQYALAEIANIRTRSAKDRSEMMKYGSRQLGLRMIEALMSLEIAIEAAEESPESSIDGVRLTVESMRRGLASVGITPIEVEGDNFDPSCMEALAIVPPPDGETSGTILKVVERGYMIHDRVLRPTKVIVSE